MHFIENDTNKDDGMGSPLQVYDDSMEPLIPAGSFVFVDKYQKPESGDIVFAGSIDSMGMLKTTIRRFVVDSVFNNDWLKAHLEPINPKWKPSAKFQSGAYCILMKVVGYALGETDFDYQLIQLIENKKEKSGSENESKTESE